MRQLSLDEQVAVDHILENRLDVSRNHGEEILVQLVPDDGRRGYLITLTAQLRALGVSLHDELTLAELEGRPR